MNSSASLHTSGLGGSFCLPIRSPFEYKTSDVGCWRYSLQALAAADTSATSGKVLDLKLGGWETKVDLGFPSSMIRVLNGSGFSAAIKHARTEGDRELVGLIKHKLDERGLPLVVFVGLPIKIPLVGVRHCMPHWLSVWGYNERGVYVYCSATEVEACEVPSGNTFLSWETLLQKWRGLDFLKRINWDRIFLDVVAT